MCSPESKLDACSYDSLSLRTVVLHKQTLGPYIWVQIPGEFASENELYQVDKLDPSAVEVEYFDSIQRDARRPWLRMCTTLLDQTSGKHIYRLSFVNVYTNEVTPLYISYIMQDDEPEKPYIYMNRE